MARDPRLIVRLDGAAEMEKSGGGAADFTVKRTVVWWIGLPVVSVPVIVKVYSVAGVLLAACTVSVDVG